MATSKLTRKQRTNLFTPLFEQVKGKLEILSKGDPKLMQTLRQRLAKELVYMERGTPKARRELRASMLEKQKGACASCKKPLPEKGIKMDLIDDLQGLTESNVRLIHRECTPISQVGRAA